MIAEFKLELEELIAAEIDAVTTTKPSFLLLSVYSILLFLAIYYFIYKKAIARNVKKLVDSSPFMVIGDCDEGLIKDFNQSTRQINWDQIKQVKEDSERYFLYIPISM